MQGVLTSAMVVNQHNNPRQYSTHHYSHRSNLATRLVGFTWQIYLTWDLHLGNNITRLQIGLSIYATFIAWLGLL